jgi:hypothetical protein
MFMDDTYFTSQVGHILIGELGSWGIALCQEAPNCGRHVVQSVDGMFVMPANLIVDTQNGTAKSAEQRMRGL